MEHRHEEQEHTHSEQARGRSRCALCEAGDAVERLFEAFGPSEDATQHFRQSRVEFLKGIRAMLDDQIEGMARPRKGTRVVVE